MSPEKKTDEEEVVEEEVSVASELDDMLSAFGQPPNEDSEEESKEDESETEEEVDEKETEEGEEDDSEGEPEKEEDPTEEPDEKDKIITELREKLAEKETVVEEEKDPEPYVPEAQDFIGDRELDDILESKESFNDLLNAVYSKGISDRDNVLKEIPDMVKANVSMMGELTRAKDKFYEDNPDLEKFQKVVAAVSEEIFAKDSDKSLEDLMDEVGKEARSRLELHKESVDKIKEKKQPKLPKKKGTRTHAEKSETTNLEDQLSDMADVVRR